MKKEEKKEEIIKAIIRACKQMKAPPHNLEDFFAGNWQLYEDVVHACT